MGFTDEELEDYLDSALLDAVMFCIGFGVPPEDILTCTVASFGDIYQSIRRVETHREMETLTTIRVAVGADKKGYKEYLEGACVWLHEVGRAAILKGKKKPVAGISELMKDFKGHVRG